MVHDRRRVLRLNRLCVELKNSLRVPADDRVTAAMDAKGDFADALSRIETGEPRDQVLESLRSHYWRLRANPENHDPDVQRRPLTAYVVMTCRSAAEADQVPEVQAFRDTHLDGGLLFEPPTEHRNFRQLEGFQSVAAVLSRRFGWDARKAEEFVLYGWLPKPHSYRILKRRPGVPNQIILTLDEHATVEDAKSLLLAAKADPHARPKGRALSMKTARQAAFALEVNAGWTWEAAMAEWNARYPEHAYPETACPNFQNHVHEAFERVFHADLEWYGCDGRPPTKAEQLLSLAELTLERKLVEIHPTTGESVLKGKDRARSEAELEDVRQRQAKLEQALASV